MATTVAKLNIHLGADAGQVTTAFNSAQSTVQRFSQSLGGFASSIRNLVAAYAGMQSIRALVGVTSDAEDASVSFRVLLGDVESAKKMIESIRSFAAVSPQENVTLRDAAKLLLNFGVASEEIIPTLKMLTDVAGSDAEKLKSLALVFGQVSANGRLTGGDLLQLINAGFNPLQEIAKRTGETMEEVRKRMEAGQITIIEVKQAFQDATGPGGRFFGMASEQSQTLAGRFSTLKDSVTELSIQIGNKLLPAMKAAVELGVTAVDWLKNMDSFTVKQTLKIVGMVAAFVAFQRIVPAIVGGIRAIVEMYQAWAKAQATLTALQGVKGLAMLAGGLLAASAAAVAIDSQFDQLSQSMNATQSGMESTVEAVNSVSESLGDLRTSSMLAMEGVASGGVGIAGAVSESAKNAADEIEKTRQKYKAMEDGIRNQGTVSAAERFTSEGFQAIFGAKEQARVQDEIKKLREQEAKAVERLERGQKEIVRAIRGNTIINHEVNV